MAGSNEPMSESAIRAFNTFQEVIVIFGIFANLSFTITVFIKSVESRYTTLLLRNQSMIDCSVCLVSFLLLVVPANSVTGVFFIDWVACRVFYSQTIYWFLVHMSIINLVFTAFDRYWAVVTAQSYKQRIKTKIGMTYLILFLMPTIVICPATLQSRLLDNGTCLQIPQFDGQIMQDFFKGYAIMWACVGYTIPTVLFVYLYGSVYLFLKKTMSGQTSSSSDKFRQATKMFTLSTSVITLIFVVAFAYDVLYYILGFLEVTKYVINSPLGIAGVFMTALNSVVNPFVYVILMKNFRMKCMKVWIPRRVLCRLQSQVDNKDNSTTLE